MPGCIQISAIQLPVTAPLFLQVALGKREYSGNIGQDDFSFPVTSLRESMVMMLYNADMELISKAELKTKAVVESGTMDVVFTLDRGGKIILQLQFLLNDEDRKCVQEMRNSAIKRKQQELLGNGYELYLQDGPLFKYLTERINNIVPSKGDQPTLRKCMSLDDLQGRATFSGVSLDPHMGSRDLLLQCDRNTSIFDDLNPIDTKEGCGEPEGGSSSAVKKMISAFESSSSQGTSSMARIKSESWLKGMSVSSETSSKSSLHGGASLNSSDHAQTELVARRHAMLSSTKSNAYESRRRATSSREGAAMQMKNVRGNDSRRRSQAKHRRSKGPYSLEQEHSMGLSRYFLHHPLNHLVATSSIWIHPHVCITTASRQLKDLVELEHSSSSTRSRSQQQRAGVGLDADESASDADERRNATPSTPRTGGFPMLDGWLVNQGVRAVIVIIACGAIFLNNR